MRLFLHDFGAYPFPLQLARSLAKRGHEVQWAFCSALTSNPGGGWVRLPEDPPTLQLVPLPLREPMDKYRFVKRWRQEREGGHRAVEALRRFNPDVVVSSNTPLDAQAMLFRETRHMGIPFVFWLQDVIGIATRSVLRRKIPIAGDWVGRYYEALERRLLRESAAVVPITDDFRPLLHRYGIPDARIQTVENWAPIEDLPVRPVENGWKAAQGLAEKRLVVYSGTLSMKHNPELLAHLAESLRGMEDVRVVVLSQGAGATYLKEQQAVRDLSNLVLLPFQPYTSVPDVQGAASVLVAVLEPEAAAYSVPSKVLSYLCAARPLVLAVPPDNLAARLVVREEAGTVVPPDDLAGFARAAHHFLSHPAEAHHAGTRGRAYAERAFDLERITDRFEHTLFTLKY